MRVLTDCNRCQLGSHQQLIFLGRSASYFKFEDEVVP